MGVALIDAKMRELLNMI